MPDLTVTRRVRVMVDEYECRYSTVNGRGVVAGWMVVGLILLVVVVTTGI